MKKTGGVNKKMPLEEKTMQELKEIAREKGVTVKKEWKRADLIKALKKIKPPVKKKKEVVVKIQKIAAKKPVEKKTAGVKTARKKTAKKKTAAKASPKKTAAEKSVTKAVKKPVQKKKAVKPAAKKAVRGAKKSTAPSAFLHNGAVVPVVPSLVKVPAMIPSPEIKPLHVYEEDRIVLLARDPNCIFAYWAIGEKTYKTLRKKLPGSFLALRVYDVSGASVENANSFFDIRVSERIGSWHIEVKQSDNEFLVEIGFLSPAGTFLPAARSNRILTPGARVGQLRLDDWIARKLYKEAYNLDLEEMRRSS
ncbi:MAG: DUF4912 domain-containing protein [Nitrospirae bacterium]|nr:DUF4912 domain-containing protein [Nitrospirota bacterium]